MWIRTSAFVLALGFSAIASVGEFKQEQDLPTGSNRPFMQMKMEYAKSILEGIALENFDGIKRNSQKLLVMSHESAWNVIQAPEYLELSAEFRGTVRRLEEAADSGNIDGATLAWLEVNLSCVRCHKHLRQKKQVPQGRTGG